MDGASALREPSQAWHLGLKLFLLEPVPSFCPGSSCSAHLLSYNLGNGEAGPCGVCLASQAMEMMAGLALPMEYERKKVAQRMLLWLFQLHSHPFWGNSPHSEWIILESLP